MFTTQGRSSMSALQSIVRRISGCTYQISRFCTAVQAETKPEESLPIISKKLYGNEDRLYQKHREVWLENLDTIEQKKLGLITLHPDVYAMAPRIDIVHQNVRWQRLYRWVSYTHAKTRAEIKGRSKKPWPQKGTGRARHGSTKSPLWHRGGVAHGPRNPTTYFYMLPFYSRVAGLTTSLSIKLAQDDLHVIKDLEIPSQERSYIEDLIEVRNWGPSVLFVDTEDIMPENITIATDTIGHVNLMPVYGLNVYSMMKHDTLVLTERAARLIEEKILYHLNRKDSRKLLGEFKLNQQ